MAKIKLHRIHKIKIHPNRWFIWALVYVFLVFVCLLSYIVVSEINLESQITAENSFVPWHSYTDSRLGFGVRIPADWSIEANSQSSISFLPADVNENGVNVSVLAPASEKSLRKTLKIKQEQVFSVAGVSGKKILNNLGSGHLETVILAIHRSKLYVLRGSNNLVEKILLTFHFTTR